jgi:hypothetical protein
MQPRRPQGGFRTRRLNKAISYFRHSQRTMGHEWGSNLTAGSLPTSAPCVLTKARRAPRPCRAGSASSWKRLAKDTLIETGRSAKDRLEQYKKAAKK